MDPKPPTRLATTAYLVVTALLIAFLATGVILTATTIVGAVRGDHSITQDRYVTPEHLTALPANIKPTDNIPVTVTIDHASPTQLFLRLAMTLLPGLLIVALLWQLWVLLRSARHGDPSPPPTSGGCASSAGCSCSAGPWSPTSPWPSKRP